MPKKVLIALPPEFLAVIDAIARAEHRTRSDLIREACRRYAQGYADKSVGMPKAKWDSDAGGWSVDRVKPSLVVTRPLDEPELANFMVQ